MIIREVWKYKVTYDDVCELMIPEGAGLMHFDMQQGQPTLWALVDPNRELVARHFHIAGTGHKLEGLMRHVGTTLDPPFVWHLFELLE